MELRVLFTILVQLSYTLVALGIPAVVKTEHLQYYIWYADN